MNKELIEKHYKFLKHCVRTEVRLFGKNLDGKQLSYSITSDSEFIKTVENYPDYNVGVGVHERANGGIEDKDVTDMRLIVIDIDSKEPDVIADCEKKLKANELPWAAKVFTGQKGYHYYFKIKLVSDNRKIREILRNVRYYFIHELDIPVDTKCFNASRIFRVWGSNNKGADVELIDFNPDLPDIDASEFFPLAKDIDEDSNLISKDKHFNAHVIDNFPLFDALYKDPTILPIKENTEFNDILLKNIAAYIQKKDIKDLRPWYKLIRLKKHQKGQLTTWLKRPRFFNAFEVISNVRKHYFSELYLKYCKPLQQIPSHQLMYMEDEGDDWKEIKRKYRETDSFIVNKQFKMEGIITLIDEHKLTMPLAKVYQGVTDPNFYYKLYLDEPGFKRGLSRTKTDEMDIRILGTISSTFYAYKFVTNNNIQIRVFSEEKMADGYYDLQGMLLEFPDKFNIGTQCFRDSITYGFFLHSYINKELKYKSLEELYQDLPIEGEDLYRYVMTEVEQTKNPTYYKTSDFYRVLYMSFLLSSVGDRGEKLNIVIFGPSGTGKTPQLKAISEKFGEEQFYSGTSLTIPGMTVSFYTDPAKKGALLESRRLCAIDEFFKIFNRLDSPSEITKANDYFDNQPVNAISGKSRLKVQSTCKVLAVSNPTFKNNKSLGTRKKMDLREMLQHYDPDFWGRFLIINQTKSDHKWIHDKNNKEVGLINIDIDKDKFIAFYDFFNNMDLSKYIDNKKFGALINSIRVPEDLEEIYKKICIRVPAVLFDGLVKWNMFCEKREAIIIDKDYKDFESLWVEVVSRWFNPDEDCSNVVLNLTGDEKDIITKISNKSFMEMRIFIEECRNVDIDYKEFKRRLVSHKIVNYFSSARKLVFNNEMAELDKLEKDLPYNNNETLTNYK